MMTLVLIALIVVLAVVVEVVASYHTPTVVAPTVVAPTVVAPTQASQAKHIEALILEHAIAEARTTLMHSEERLLKSQAILDRCSNITSFTHVVPVRKAVAVYDKDRIDTLHIEALTMDAYIEQYRTWLDTSLHAEHQLNKWESYDNLIETCHMGHHKMKHTESTATWGPHLNIYQWNDEERRTKRNNSRTRKQGKVKRIKPLYKTMDYAEAHIVDYREEPITTVEYTEEEIDAIDTYNDMINKGIDPNSTEAYNELRRSRLHVL